MIEAYKDANRNGQWPVDVLCRYLNKCKDAMERCPSLIEVYIPLYVNIIAELS